MMVHIRDRYTNAVRFECNIGPGYDYLPESVRLGAAVQRAHRAGANLTRANLAGVSLVRANMPGVDFTAADLEGADLTDARLAGAWMGGANLAGAHLQAVQLQGARLMRANLAGANLVRANLVYAFLREADFSCADITGANFVGADLTGAKLDGVLGLETVIARTRILPEGDLIGWKKVRVHSGYAVIKLRIPAEARRINAFGRKCRAEFVDVLEAPEGAHTKWNGLITTYIAGQRVHCNWWDDDWKKECAGGIHFFITREEAEEW